jgi:hypothetical protein
MANDNNSTADEFVPKDALEAQTIRLICRKLCEAEVHIGEAAFEATIEKGLNPDFGRVEGLCAAALCAVGEAHLALCGLFPADAHIEAVKRDLYPLAAGRSCPRELWIFQRIELSGSSRGTSRVASAAYLSCRGVRWPGGSQKPPRSFRKRSPPRVDDDHGDGEEQPAPGGTMRPKQEGPAAHDSPRFSH